MSGCFSHVVLLFVYGLFSDLALSSVLVCILRLIRCVCLACVLVRCTCCFGLSFISVSFCVLRPFDCSGLSLDSVVFCVVCSCVGVLLLSFESWVLCCLHLVPSVLPLLVL